MTTMPSMPGLPVPLPRRRVIAYIDGFNLYYGLKTSNWRRFLWLDLPALAKSLILNDQDLIVTKYFTSRIDSPAGKQKRQLTYLEALDRHCGNKLNMYFGHYQSQPWKCNACGVTTQVSGEKKTDVNIAVEVMTDAFKDSFDTCLLITADSDLVPAVSAVKRFFPEKRLVVAFPPNRYSVELQQEAHTSFPIGRAKFAQAQMPDLVQKADGTKLQKPAKWSHQQTAFGSILGTALGFED
jgi:uncharacterized LabA/DUF88 family protein